MVVSKLEPYIEEKIPEALKSGNLRNLISQELKCGVIPTIVLDSSATRNLFGSSTISMWQPRLVKKDVESFVNKIISCGANLIVVLRGHFSGDMKSWFYKHNKHFQDQKIAFQASLEGDIHGFENFKNNPCISNTFLSISSNHYKVFCASKYTHKDVAETAIKEDCLAVIGQDSNYLIYEGIKYYILTKSVNTKTLDCKIYDRTKLLEYLKLKLYHLPLFATLCGNDVSAPFISAFHKKMSLSSNDKFHYIAQMIKCFSDKPFDHINDMVNLINLSYVKGDIIKKSLDMYLNFDRILPKDEQMVFANKRQRIGQWSNSTYIIFTQKMLKNPNKSALFGSAFAFLRPFRSRIYGILLYADVTPVVQEWALEEQAHLTTHKSLTPVKVPAIKPHCKHPGLVQLYNNNTPNVYYMRWNLFCNSFNRSLNQFTIKSLPPGLVVPILALYYLEREAPLVSSQKIFKEKFEIEMFLLVALLVHEDKCDPHLENYEFERADAKVANLIFYFLETCYTLEILNEACGLVISKEKSCICNFFDGILLHSVYKKMSEGTKWYEFFGNNMVLEILFISLMDFILQDIVH